MPSCYIFSPAPCIGRGGRDELGPKPSHFRRITAYSGNGTPTAPFRAISLVEPTIYGEIQNDPQFKNSERCNGSSASGSRLHAARTSHRHRDRLDTRRHGGAGDLSTHCAFTKCARQLALSPAPFPRRAIRQSSTAARRRSSSPRRATATKFNLSNRRTAVKLASRHMPTSAARCH